MPKVHNIGKNHFVQLFRYPADWGWKVVVRGNTQEISEPYRVSKPFMIRLPFYHTLVVGKWTGQLNEEEALENALQGRVLTNEDFDEEKGWKPAAVKIGEASLDDWDY